MRDFVVYHNTEQMGSLSKKPPFHVISKKEFRDLPGDHVWVISGEGKPRQYFLEYSFVIDESGPHPKDPSMNLISGQKGDSYSPRIRLDQASWFPRFLRTQGSFAFGFNVIGSTEHVQALRRVAKRHAKRK